MRVSEWIALAYFIALALVAVARRSESRRWPIVAGVAVVCASLVIGLAAEAEVCWWLRLARDWAPAAYLILGYWLPGGLQRPPNARLEAWLIAADRRLFAWLGLERTMSSKAAERTPRSSWYTGTLEAVYLLVYPFVPACFLLLYLTATPDAIDRFWSAVLLAGYACYGTLPWLPARPPREVEAYGHNPDPQRARGMHRALRRLNERVSGSMGVGGDTLPSGHVAVAVAAALAVTGSLPATGALLLVLTMLIALATVVGWYHYAVDALGGWAVGLLAWLVVAWHGLVR